MFYLIRTGTIRVTSCPPARDFTGIGCAEGTKIRWGDDDEVDVSEVEALFARPACSAPHLSEEPSPQNPHMIEMLPSSVSPISNPLASDRAANAPAYSRAHSTPTNTKAPKSYEVRRPSISSESTRPSSCSQSQASSAGDAPPRRSNAMPSPPGGQRRADFDFSALALEGRAKPVPGAPLESAPTKPGRGPPLKSAPTKPVPEAPFKSAPTKPVPEAPLKSVSPKPGPEAPLKSVSPKPVPEAPFKSAPMKPVPEARFKSAPTKPVPEAPLKSVSPKPRPDAPKPKLVGTLFKSNPPKFKSTSTAASSASASSSSTPVPEAQINLPSTTPGPTPKKRTLGALPPMKEIIGHLAGSSLATPTRASPPTHPRADTLSGGALFHKRRAFGSGEMPPIEPRLGKAAAEAYRTT